MNQKLSLSGRYLDDTELSLKAKGLFALMLDIRDKCTTAGRPWYCTIQKLAARNVMAPAQSVRRCGSWRTPDMWNGSGYIMTRADSTGCSIFCIEIHWRIILQWKMRRKHD